MALFAERVGLIDTENASASLYADVHDFQTAAWYPPYDAAKLAAAIHDAQQAGVVETGQRSHGVLGEPAGGRSVKNAKA